MTLERVFLKILIMEVEFEILSNYSIIGMEFIYIYLTLMKLWIAAWYNIVQFRNSDKFTPIRKNNHHVIIRPNIFTRPIRL